MVISVDVPDFALATILEQVRRALPGDLDKRRASIRLGAGFDVWTLTKAPGPSIALAQAATETGSLHHQLFAGDEPVGFVRSRSEPGGKPKVTQVFESPLGRRIEESIRDANPRVASNVPARILTAAPYHTFAFWFSDLSQLYVISAPGTYTRIKPGALETSTEFLNQLGQEKPIGGATAKARLSKGE